MCQIPDFPLIGGYLPTSFIDWEGRVTAVLFVTGCNFRCPFCHNYPLVTGIAEGLDPGPVLADILRRRLFLDGVVVSGGEPTLYPRLTELLAWIHEVAKLPVKLDTNGTHPEILEKLLGKGLLSAAAMDIKAPWEKYELLAGVAVNTEAVRASLKVLSSLGDDLELRTTMVPALMSPGDLLEIREELGFDPRWIVQLFNPSNALDPELRETQPGNRESLQALLPDVKVRG